jgi:hypothetical protein
MTDMSKWEGGQTLTPEEEPEYLKDFCEYLRGQETLSPVREENGAMVCDVVLDETTAHAADIIEELLERIAKLEYELKEAKG